MFQHWWILNPGHPRYRHPSLRFPPDEDSHIWCTQCKRIIVRRPQWQWPQQQSCQRKLYQHSQPHGQPYRKQQTSAAGACTPASTTTHNTTSMAHNAKNSLFVASTNQPTNNHLNNHQNQKNSNPHDHRPSLRASLRHADWRLESILHVLGSNSPYLRIIGRNLGCAMTTGDPLLHRYRHAFWNHVTSNWPRKKKLVPLSANTVVHWQLVALSICEELHAWGNTREASNYTTCTGKQRSLNADHRARSRLCSDKSQLVTLSFLQTQK